MTLRGPARSVKSLRHAHFGRVRSRKGSGDRRLAKGGLLDPGEAGCRSEGVNELASGERHDARIITAPSSGCAFQNETRTPN